MSFKLSSTGEYAVRLVTFLASAPANTIIPAKNIAQAKRIPLKFLQQIITRFVKLGLLRGHPGLGGGVSMPMATRDVSLLHIIEAAEGPIFLNQCVMGADGCVFSGSCAVHLVWEEAQACLTKILSSKTIGELAQTSAQLEELHRGEQLASTQSR